jgi:transposase
VVSVLAGKTIANLKDRLPRARAVVRLDRQHQGLGLAGLGRVERDAVALAQRHHGGGEA